MRLPVITAALAITALVGVSLAGTFTHRSNDHNSTSSSAGSLAALKTHAGEIRQADSVPQPRAVDAGYHLSLFDRPEAAPAAPGVVSPPATPAQKFTIAFASSESSPVEGYAFTGTVTVNGTVSALIEDKKTGEGVYVHTGDSFQGGVVGEITPAQIAIRVGGRDWTIARNEVFSVVPLDDSAAVADNDATASATNALILDGTSLDFALGNTVLTDDISSMGNALTTDVIAAPAEQTATITFGGGGLQLSNISISLDSGSGVIQLQSNIVQPAQDAENEQSLAGIPQSADIRL